MAGIGFFKFLKEIFNGTYFNTPVNPVNNPGAFDGRRIGDGTSNSNASSPSQTESAIQHNIDAQSSGFNKFFSSLSDLFPALVNRITASELTGAEREQNAFNAEQAQADRDFQEYMSNTEYQRGVADMRAAGVNPALAIGNGGASAPSGAMAQGSGSGSYGSSMSDLMQLLLLKPQRDLMEKQGTAAILNAEAAKEQAAAASKNAGTREGELGVSQYDAETRRMLANNEIRLGDNTIRFTDAQIESIAQSIAESSSRINLQGLEAALKELDIQFTRDTLETRKELLVQELVYKAVEMSNIQAQTSLYYKEGKLLDNEAISQAWKERHPKLASALDGAGVATGVIGNVLRGSISGVIGRWSK